jgi:hypothetical protein
MKNTAHWIGQWVVWSNPTVAFLLATNHIIDVMQQKSESFWLIDPIVLRNHEAAP